MFILEYPITKRKRFEKVNGTVKYFDNLTTLLSFSSFQHGFLSLESSNTFTMAALGVKQLYFRVFFLFIFLYPRLSVVHYTFKTNIDMFIISYLF